ncbi:MAG: substrate-binding periplasmic protein [Acidobacteriota bacterium]
MPISRTIAQVALALTVVLQGWDTRCAPLQMVYPNRPPYFYTLDGAPAGTLYETTAGILAEAGIEAVFTEMPSRRILYEMQQDQNCTRCGFGWFKTPQREAFARFSLPIHVQAPLVAAVLTRNLGKTRNAQNLSELLNNGEATIGVVDGWSYGDAVDVLLRGAENHVIKADDSRQQALMLANGRCLLILAREDELPDLLRFGRLTMADVAAIRLEKESGGVQRYIMCGKGVPDEVMARIDAAIARLKRGR